MKANKVCKIAKNAFGIHVYAIPLSSLDTLSSTKWNTAHY
jgi:hypothetical protein